MTRDQQTADQRKRMIDGMADDYSVRARRARVDQGLPEVLDDPVVLNRLAEMLTPAPAHADAA